MQASLDGFHSEPKKICWLENAEIYGGAEMFGLEMLEKVADNFSQELEIHYLHNGNNKHVLQSLSAIQAGLPKHIILKAETFDMPKLSGGIFSILKNSSCAVKSLRSRIEKHNYDIFYANTVRTGIILRLTQLTFLRRLPAKFFFFSHDYTFPKKLQKFFFAGYTKILSCSYPVKNFLIGNSVPSSSIIVIENGVESKKFSTLKKRKIPSFRIGVVGRITHWKGQLTVLRAARRISELFPDIHLTLTFYGEPSSKVADQEFFLRLKNFVVTYHLEKMVFFKGFTPITQALEQIDILLHAAQEPEPFGRTPLEGAASGRPLLLSRLGTPAQIFTDGYNALFFEPHDKKDLAEKILMLVRDSELQLKLSVNAQKLVEEKFSLEVIASRFWKAVLG